MSSNGVSPEQCLSRLRELDTEREELIRREAAMGERYNSYQRDLAQLVEQMKELGTSPQTIQSDLTKYLDKLKVDTEGYELELARLRDQLDKTDASLLDLDQKSRKS